MRKTTSERLKEYMHEYNLRQIDILNKCKPYCEKYGIKFGRSILSQYISGAFEPGQDKLTILAKALNVSEAWLMGFDVPMRPTDNIDEVINNLSDSKKALVSKFIELFSSLTDDEMNEEIKHLEFTLYKRNN